MKSGKYQFFSWARRGVASGIVTPDDLGRGTSTQIERAKIPLSVTVNTQTVSKSFSIYGPGDVSGINKNMIIRTEPRNWITDFEPNYLAFVEFYDEDFPWRFTPAKPQGERLRPWITLFVLKRSEFEHIDNKPAHSSIRIRSGETLPPPEESWLWAHVHSNKAVSTEEPGNYQKFLLSLNKTVNDDPDQIFSRLCCPRRLEADTEYHAFIVPAFETGRLAGLSIKAEGVNAQQSSWKSDIKDLEIPVYYEWFFRTGKKEDFEYLVKLIEPREVDPRIGSRPMDCSCPGFSKLDGSGPVSGTLPPILGLEGALKSPASQSTVFPASGDTFREDVKELIDVNGTREADMISDPVVTIPFYGHKHALVDHLDVDESWWPHELNRDPRHRTAAGFGTKVIQRYQEKYMQKAWDQVEVILAANRKIRETRFAMAVADQIHTKFFQSLPKASLLAVSKPVLSRVMGSPTTVFHQLAGSRLSTTLLTGGFRRLARPGGPVISKKLNTSAYDFEHMIARVNSGAIAPAPPKQIPEGLPNTRDLADKIFPSNASGFRKWLLRNCFWLFILAIVFILSLSVLLPPVLAALAPVVPGYMYVRGQKRRMEAAESLDDVTVAPDVIKDIPQRPTFGLHLYSEPTTVPFTPTAKNRDSVEAGNFRKALTHLHTRFSFILPLPVFESFKVMEASQKVLTALNANTSFPTKMDAMIQFPLGIDLKKPENIIPAMAYPDIDEPMYKKLTEFSQELLIPNLKLVPNNTVTLLKTNQKFIESYLVGLNHEMGRELLWREYPTDERCSCFRQFWDVDGVIQSGDLKDIKPIDTWSRPSRLGEHNNRDADRVEEQLVLLIRGDLFKRYPNTLIFAQKAEAGKNPNDEFVIDTELDESQFLRKTRFPLYKAEVEPDVKMFGFDLSIEQARGTEKTPGFPDQYGWFFIIHEIPGEPRLGMDIQTSTLNTWDDLSWGHFSGEMDFISASNRPNPDPARDNIPDRWGINAAQMAYILYQKPVMIAIHAQEMLRDL